MRVSEAVQAVASRRPMGKWHASQRPSVQRWVVSLLNEATQNDASILDPSLVAFRQLVNSSQNWKALSNNMFIQSSKNYDPTGAPALKSFDEFIHAVNVIIKSAPPFLGENVPPTAMGLIGFPINAVLDWPMGTMAGYEFWLIPAINASFKVVLNTWGTFLKSPASQAGLKDWLSLSALQTMAQVANGGQVELSFDQIFVCDPAAPFHGFESWDAFFTRRFRKGLRPVDFPDDAAPTCQCLDPTLVISNACESAPLQVVESVQLHDQFWLKSQPYSLDRMLNSNPMTSLFVNGTVYQAFLSAESYHRWHAPVSGTVVGLDLVPGSYYSENYFEGLSGCWRDLDPAAPNYSQPYISAVATRAIIWIQANNPAIGLMAIVFIGMAEVAGCEFTVSVNDSLSKGQEIGMFHFGGSSYCMVFRKEVKLSFFDQPPWGMTKEKNNFVNSALAIASTRV
ncbi:hypothetical protein ACLX1H_004850 [Fusarium chlamydosporum]